jgi:hypothetical protein
VAFDALTCFVWIDPFESDGPLDVSARGAGALCARHADRLVAPRGWAVQDRRGRDLQLWSDRPASDQGVSVSSTAAAASGPPEPTSSNPPSSSALGTVIVLEQHLPFDAAAAAPTTTDLPRSESSSFSSTSGDDIDVVLDAVRSPLLSRAFNAARTRHAG